jgi:hypothetical protein
MISQRGRNTGAALHLDQRAAHRAVGDANGLQHEWHEVDAALDALELQVHQIVIDLDALDGEAVGHRAADTDDVELHGTELARDVPDRELQSAGGVERRPDECRRRHDSRDDQDRGEGEQQAAQAEHRYSLGEKLMCRRGLRLGQKVPPVAVGGEHGSVSGSAMSMPSVSTGRRTRTPTPTEYWRLVPKRSKALP